MIYLIKILYKYAPKKNYDFNQTIMIYNNKSFK